MALALGFVVLASVVAVIVGTRSNPDASPSVPPHGAPAVPELGAPTGLTADRAAFRVRLTWEGSDGDVKIYRITRNGDVVATVPTGRSGAPSGGVPSQRLRATPA